MFFGEQFVAAQENDFFAESGSSPVIEAIGNNLVGVFNMSVEVAVSPVLCFGLLIKNPF